MTDLIARWHEYYCHWYDHDRAGHRIRAVAWGWLTDRTARRAR